MGTSRFIFHIISIIYDKLRSLTVNSVDLLEIQQNWVQSYVYSIDNDFN